MNIDFDKTFKFYWERRNQLYYRHFLHSLIRIIKIEREKKCLCLYGDFIYRDGTPNPKRRCMMPECPIHGNKNA